MSLLEGSRFQKIPDTATSLMLWYKFKPMFNMELNREVHSLTQKYIHEGYSKRQARFLAWEDLNFWQEYRDYILTQPDAIKELKKIWDISLNKDVYVKCSCSGPPCRRYVLIDIMHELFNDGTIEQQQIPRPQDNKGNVVIIPANYHDVMAVRHELNETFRASGIDYRIPLMAQTKE